MARSMAEMLAMPGVGYEIAGQRIDMFARDTRTNALYGGQLCIMDDLIDIPERIVDRIAQIKCACQVTAITVDFGSKVNNDGIPKF